MNENITPEEKIKKLEKEYKAVTTQLSICKNERPTTSAQRLKWRSRLKILKHRQIRIIDKINDLGDEIAFTPSTTDQAGSINS